MEYVVVRETGRSKPKMRGRKLRSDVHWQQALDQKAVKQGLRALIVRPIVKPLA
jgi:hypothetical protein